MEWQKVDRNKLNQPRKETILGVDFHVYFDYDDMPVGVRGEYKAELQRFVIEFRYNNEPLKLMPVQYDEHVVLKVDKSSKRLFAVEIDVDALQVDKVRLLGNVEDVLDAIAPNAKKLGINRVENYVATSGAFKQVQKDLALSL